MVSAHHRTRSPPKRWYAGCSPSSFAFTLILFAMIAYLSCTRHRRLGHQQPGGLGLGPSPTSSSGSASVTPGTLISAILFLFRQKWRTSINRFAEAMTHLRRHLRRALPRHSRRPRRGWSTGCCPIPNPDATCGRTSAARCCGTCSRSAPTPRSRCCSGTWVWSPTWPRLRDRATTQVRQIVLRRLRLGWRGSATATGTTTRWPT